jgi:hypothetical protein
MSRQMPSTRRGNARSNHLERRERENTNHEGQRTGEVTAEEFKGMISQR